MDAFKSRLVNLILRLRASSPIDMARYAFDHTRFYRRFYGDRPLEDFGGLPVLTKYDIAGVSPYDFLSDEFRGRAFLYGETSGSSGSPTPSFMTRREFEGLVALSLMSPYAPLIKGVVEENRTAVNGLTFGFTIAGFTFGAILQKAGFMTAQIGTRSTIASPERMARTIAKLKPSAMSATPLDFMSWMKIMKEDSPKDYDEVKEGIRLLISTAEPCAISRQRQIEDYFGLTHINTYASVDGFVSLQCPCGEMHLIDNLLDVEIFDGSMNLIGPAGTGRLCFTNLVKKTTPMVRYLLDDLVTVRKSNCPHGYHMSIYPHGRYELSVDLDGQTIGNIDFEEAIYRHGLFMNYHVDLLDDRVEVTLEEYDADAEADISGVKAEISDLTNLPCSVHIVEMGRMTPYRRVREAKSIIKVLDRREASRQEMPVVL